MWKVIYLTTILLFSTSLLAHGNSINDKFEWEINLYSASDIKKIVPEIEVSKNADSSNYNYIYGWIRAKESYREFLTRKTAAPACKIVIWNKFFKYSFSLNVVDVSKSYFLIPLGSYVYDKDFQIKVSTIP